MKKSIFFKWGLLICAAILTLNSCSFGEDEKGNEIVDDPMKDTEVYYIDGIVYDMATETLTEKAKGLAGVEVKIGEESVTTDANGVFQFVVNSKKEYQLEFAKSNYISVDATATIATNAPNRSMVTLGIKMTPKSIPTKVGDTGKVVTDKGEKDDDECTAHLNVPAGALSKDCDISITPYDVPAPASTTVKPGQETIEASLKNLAITANHNEFDEKLPLTITLRNIVSENAYFNIDDVEVWHNNIDASTRADWVKEKTTITLEGGNYKFQTTKLKDKYSIVVKTLKDTGAEKNSEYNKVNGKNEVKVDNKGNTSAIKDFVLKVESKAGWDYTTSPYQALTTAGVMGVDLPNISGTISRIIEAQEGGYPGYYTVNHEMKTNISGNHIMYYRNKAKFCEKTYTFNLVINKVNTKAVIKVKAYTGREDLYENVDGTQHSGGAM